MLNLNHHATTTVLRPFFRDYPGEPVPEKNFWTLWCKGRLTEADTPTIRLGATPSGLTSAHLHRPPLNLKKHKETQRKPKPTPSLKNCSYVCAYHCVQLLHTTQNSSDNLPSYTPDNHHSPDDVYWRGGKKAGGHLS